MNAHDALKEILAGRNLSRDATEGLFGRLMDGELSPVLKSALLVGLAMKGEAVSEIAGAAAAMRRRVVAIPHNTADVVDTCGTGGDGLGTFNISTAAALVAAAAGVPIAKHGNRSVSSRSGSADVLAALGVRIDIEPAIAGRAVDDIGISFLFAPNLHPAMKEVMPVRKELAVRTIFNVLGPLTNPAGARRQILGVYSRHLVEPMAKVLRDLGSDHALVVHGNDGLDEITTTDTTHVCEVKDGRVHSFEWTPEELGVARAQPADLLGGAPDDNAASLAALLAGQTGALHDIVAVNAGAAVLVSGRVDNMASGIAAARQALLSGDAHRKLEQLKEIGQ